MKTIYLKGVQRKFEFIGIQQTSFKDMLKVQFMLLCLLLVLIPFLVLLFAEVPTRSIFPHIGILEFLSLFSLGYILLDRWRTGRYLRLLYYLVLVSLVFLYSSSMGFRNEIAVLYFPVLLSLQICFTSRNERFYSYLILVIAFGVLIISHLRDFLIFSLGTWEIEYNENIRLMAYLESFVLLLIAINVLLRKNRNLRRVKSRSIRNNIRLEQLTEANQGISHFEKSMQLVKSMSEDDGQFVPIFNKYFPDFLKNLLAKNPGLSTEEYKLCAYIKMGLSSKEIAQATNLSVRTIQSRKNRLRKSIGISSDLNLYNWMEGY